jgi:RsiW-degrading membrane proteinase PrsW (M82 family)
MHDAVNSALTWLSGTTYGVLGLYTLAFFTLSATFYGLRKHRNRQNMWWIIACALITVIAVLLSIRLFDLLIVCALGCDMG